MGHIKEPGKVKLIMGVIACCAGTAEEAEGLLVKKFGSIDARSAVIPFDLTGYYEEEMGKDLLRAWISFEKLVDPQELAGIKTETNKIEEGFSAGGNRRVNLDPGYIDGGKLVLASTNRMFRGQEEICLQFLTVLRYDFNFNVRLSVKKLDLLFAYDLVQLANIIWI